jgi:chromosomal replication initiator protein
MITVAAIQERVCKRYGMSLAAMQSPCRRPEVARPRHAAMYLARKLTGYSYHRIGLAFGKRNHATVYRSVHRAPMLCGADRQFSRVIGEGLLDIEAPKHEVPPASHVLSIGAWR